MYFALHAGALFLAWIICLLWCSIFKSSFEFKLIYKTISKPLNRKWEKIFFSFSSLAAQPGPAGLPSPAGPSHLHPLFAAATQLAAHFRQAGPATRGHTPPLPRGSFASAPHHRPHRRRPAAARDPPPAATPALLPCPVSPTDGTRPSDPSLPPEPGADSSRVRSPSRTRRAAAARHLLAFSDPPHI